MWLRPISTFPREETLGYDADQFPEISQIAWQQLIQKSSLTGEPLPNTHFDNQRALLRKIGSRIGKYDAHALVLGADKHLIYPFLATGAQYITLVSADANSPRRRTRDLMILAGLAYPLSPPSVMVFNEQEATIHVTSGIQAHAFYLYDMLYGEFFVGYDKQKNYDFLLDKTSYLGTDPFDLSRAVNALVEGGFWISNFKYAKNDQSAFLKLMGLQEVTLQIVTSQEAASFPGEGLHIYRKIKRFPVAWLDAIHGWYSHIKVILKSTQMCDATPLYTDETTDEFFVERFKESRLIYNSLEKLIGATKEGWEMRKCLDAIYVQLDDVMGKRVKMEKLS